MCECKKLLVVADELQEMSTDIKARLTDKTIQEIMLAQALYGVELSVKHLISQIHQAVSIEKVNGDS